MARTAKAASPVVVSVGAGMLAADLVATLATDLTYPATLTISNALNQPLVLSQAQPIKVIAAGGTITHDCQTPDQLHDIVFGMIAVGDRLQQATIGDITAA